MFEKHLLSHRSRGGWFNNFLVFDKFYQKNLVSWDIPGSSWYAFVYYKACAKKLANIKPLHHSRHWCYTFGKIRSVLPLWARKSKIKKKRNGGTVSEKFWGDQSATSNEKDFGGHGHVGRNGANHLRCVSKDILYSPQLVRSYTTQLWYLYMSYTISCMSETHDETKQDFITSTLPPEPIWIISIEAS